MEPLVVQGRRCITDRERPAFLNDHSPRAYEDASLPAHDELLERFIQRGLVGDCPELRQQQLECEHELWKERCGVAAINSAFSVIVPIHNEQRFLDSALHSLFSAHIPQGVDVQFIFVLNGCTDDSESILRDHIRRYLFRSDEDPFQAETVGHLVKRDSNASSVMLTTHLGTMSFKVVQTQQASKANALYLGNLLAYKEGHQIGLCLDANNWVEPDAIARIYGQAHQYIIDKPAERLRLVSGQPQTAYHKPLRRDWSKCNPIALLDTLVRWRKQRLSRQAVAFKQRGKLNLNGSFHAFDVEWLEEIGGPPQVAVEDIALTIVAHLKGEKIAFSDASNWSYGPNSLKADFMTQVRFIRGRLQLECFLAHYPTIKSMLDLHWPTTAPLIGKIKATAKEFLSKARSSPLAALLCIPIRILDMTYLSIARYYASQEFRHDPNSSTWKPIPGTK